MEKIIHTVRHNMKQNSDKKKKDKLKPEERKGEESGRWNAAIVS